MEKKFKEIVGITFDEFYKEHKQSLYMFLKGKNYGNSVDIEYIVDEAFVNVLKAIHQHDPEKASLKTWLFNIGWNILRREYKKKRITLSYREELYDCDIKVLDDYYTEYDYSIDEEFGALISYLNNQPDDVIKRIVYMRYAGIKLQDIADELNLSVNAVKHKLYTGLKNKIKKNERINKKSRKDI